jgi:PPOX class probable F420-dependent enzyme
VDYVGGFFTAAGVPASMSEVPEAYLDLFERPSFGNLATLQPNGFPHVTPVWIDYDGEHLLVNTARGRQKERNVQRNPAVGVSVIDPENFYRYVSAYGEVADLREAGAVEHIHELSRRYTGEDYANLDAEDGARVIVEIDPEHVIASG